jgi:hypothetical protein
MIIVVILVFCILLALLLFRAPPRKVGRGDELEQFIDLKATISLIETTPEIDQFFNAEPHRTLADTTIGIFPASKYLLNVAPSIPELCEFLAGFTFLNYIVGTEHKHKLISVLSERPRTKLITAWARWFPQFTFANRLGEGAAAICFDGMRSEGLHTFIGGHEDVSDEYLALYPAFSNARGLPVQIIRDSAPANAPISCPVKHKLFYYHMSRRQYAYHPRYARDGLCGCADCAIIGGIYEDYGGANLGEFVEFICNFLYVDSLRKVHVASRKFQSAEMIINSIPLMADLSTPMTGTILPWKLTLADAAKYGELAGALRELYGKKYASAIFRAILRAMCFGISTHALDDALYKKSLLWPHKIDIPTIINFIKAKNTYLPLEYTYKNGKIIMHGVENDISCYTALNITPEKYVIYTQLMESDTPPILADDEFCKSIKRLMAGENLSHGVVISLMPIIYLKCGELKHIYLCEDFLPEKMDGALIILYTPFMDDYVKNHLVSKYSTNVIIVITKQMKRKIKITGLGERKLRNFSSLDKSCVDKSETYTMRGLGAVGNVIIDKYFVDA